jgi:hypothetical protein
MNSQCADAGTEDARCEVEGRVLCWEETDFAGDGEGGVREEGAEDGEEEVGGAEKGGAHS